MATRTLPPGALDLPTPGTSPLAPSLGSAARRLLPAAAWLAAVVLGFALLARHDTTPGEAAPVPERWPSAAALVPAKAPAATLLVFAHPKCPCTRATLGELEVLMARTLGRVEAQVVFVRPPGVAAGWERTDLWTKAARIPGVVATADEGGAEAVRFGALTSGQVCLYDARGVLRFSGGITGARGHAGDNPGRSAVEAFLLGTAQGPSTTPVFGCRLLAPCCETGGGTCPR